MKKYEYITVYMGKTKSTEIDGERIRVNEDLNKLGEQGWELVSFYNTNYSDFPYAVLKREV